MPKIAYDDVQDLDDVEDFQSIRRHARQLRPAKPVHSPPGRVTRSEEFKCGHCKTFVGPPVSGGRHRNHCPLCLHSKHVDRKQPGDRLSECRSLMAPAGTYFRRNGEQVIVHRCLGCNVERHCRVAADDHIIACMRLELMEPYAGNVPGRDAVEELLA